MPNKVIIISGTKKSKDDFEKSSPLGKSLQKLSYLGDIHNDISYENECGLSELYNKAIAKYCCTSAYDYIIFCHDDVSIEDIMIKEKLEENFNKFDILGLAGSSYFNVKNPAWHWCDRKYWSGAVSHPVDGLRTMVSAFGPTPSRCAVIDGLFIACKSKTLVDTGLRFDEDFKFHFYDLSFCVNAIRMGLKIGTIPLWVVHTSHGAYDSEDWKINSHRFIQKYDKKG